MYSGSQPVVALRVRRAPIGLAQALTDVTAVIDHLRHAEQQAARPPGMGGEHHVEAETD